MVQAGLDLASAATGRPAETKVVQSTHHGTYHELKHYPKKQSAESSAFANIPSLLPPRSRSPVPGVPSTPPAGSTSSKRPISGAAQASATGKRPRPAVDPRVAAAASEAGRYLDLVTAQLHADRDLTAPMLLYTLNLEAALAGTGGTSADALGELAQTCGLVRQADDVLRLPGQLAEARRQMKECGIRLPNGPDNLAGIARILATRDDGTDRAGRDALFVAAVHSEAERRRMELSLACVATIIREAAGASTDSEHAAVHALLKQHFDPHAVVWSGLDEVLSPTAAMASRHVETSVRHLQTRNTISAALLLYGLAARPGGAGRAHPLARLADTRRLPDRGGTVDVLCAEFDAAVASMQSRGIDLIGEQDRRPMIRAILQADARPPQRQIPYALLCATIHRQLEQDGVPLNSLNVKNLVAEALRPESWGGDPHQNLWNACRLHLDVVTTRRAVRRNVDANPS